MKACGVAVARLPGYSRQGLPNFRLVRYADDWCLMIRGTRADAEALKEEIAGVLAAWQDSNPRPAA